MKETRQRHNDDRPTSDTIRLCFMALGAYPLLSGRNLRYVVGPDVFQVLLAKEFTKHGFEVSFITYDDGGAPVEFMDGIEVIKTYQENAHVNTVLKALGVWKGMSKAKAGIYFQQGGAVGVTPMFCRLNRKRFVTSIASDAYVCREITDWGILFRLGSELEIRLADVIIVQSEFQRTMLKRNFGKDGVLIKTPAPLAGSEKLEKVEPPIVLWVGTMADVKQPELFLELAEAIPEGAFQMIGGHLPGTQQLYDRIRERSRRIPNLEYLGVIPFDEVNDYFSRAAILVNTSKFEGFPNTFLQSWMNYTPVVSLNANPDGIICRYELGLHSRTFPQLVEHVKSLLADEHVRQEMGRNGRQYVEKEHDIVNIIKQYIQVFGHLSRL